MGWLGWISRFIMGTGMAHISRSSKGRNAASAGEFQRAATSRAMKKVSFLSSIHTCFLLAGHCSSSSSCEASDGTPSSISSEHSLRVSCSEFLVETAQSLVCPSMNTCSVDDVHQESQWSRCHCRFSSVGGEASVASCGERLSTTVFVIFRNPGAAMIGG